MHKTRSEETEVTSSGEEGVRQDDVEIRAIVLSPAPSFAPVPHINTRFPFPERPRKRSRLCMRAPSLSGQKEGL